MSMDDNDDRMIFADLVVLKLPDICLRGEENPEKILTQKTCPYRGSNPVPLHDRLTCYRQFDSSGLISSIFVKASFCSLYPYMIKQWLFPQVPEDSDNFLFQ